MQNRRCRQADRTMSRRYAFLMRIFVASIFMNSYFLVKFVLIYLSEGNNPAMQQFVKQKRSIMLEDPNPLRTNVEENINVEKEDLLKSIAETRIRKLAKQRRSILPDNVIPQISTEETFEEKRNITHGQKPLYQKETQDLDAIFRKQVASFYSKYNKVYKPFTMDEDNQHQLSKDVSTQSLRKGFHHKRKEKTKTNKKKIASLVSSNEDLCGTPTDLLIVVNSLPQNIKERLAIRYSWAEENGRKKKPSLSKETTRSQNSKVLFAIGTQSVDSQAAIVLKTEYDEYEDMILLDNIVDNYQNLALKTMRTLEWVYQNCESYFVLKTDDDCFVNKNNLLEFLQRQGVEDDLYAGRVQWSMPAIREHESKFYVPESAHPGFFLHPYASGGGYVISWNLLEGMINKSRKLTTIPIEDANVGNVLHSMNVKPSDVRDFLPFIYCNTTSVWDRPPCDYVKPYVIHGIDPYGQLWMHYHVTVLTTIQSICKQENKHRHKFDPPYYCPVDLSV